VPTLSSCSFDKHGQILIIFGKQHQHILKNDTHVQLCLSLDFYLLYLLLNWCDGNDAFWRHSVLMKQSSSFRRTHRTLSLQICVHQTVQLTTEFVDLCRNVCTNTCPRYQPLWSVTRRSASLTHGQACHRTSPTKQLVNGESSCVQAWRQIDITWTSPNWKRLFSEPAHYTTGSFQSHKQSTEENTLLHVISITAS